ncbi:MAG: acyl carrier protein [Acidimicrobiia bacterium]
MPAETHMSGEPLSPEEIAAIVCECVSDVLDKPTVAVTDRFVEDLAIDRVALFDICATLEDEFGERTVGFAFDDETLSELVRVQDLVEIVALQLGVSELQ